MEDRIEDVYITTTTVLYLLLLEEENEWTAIPKLLEEIKEIVPELDDGRTRDLIESCEVLAKTVYNMDESISNSCAIIEDLVIETIQAVKNRNDIEAELKRIFDEQRR